jgi:hypothetical protein
MTKYLQLRVHELTCIKMTENRQNFFGISLETDPDSIDISAIVTDAEEGVVAQAPPVFLGNRYTSGHREAFSSPKVIAEVAISDTEAFPRRVQMTINMAEKDDGGGFDQLVESLAHELANRLGDEVADRIDPDLAENTYYELVEREAGNIIESLFKEIMKAFGLGDDPFRPVTIEYSLRSFTDAPSGTQTVDIFEPNPAHHGKFRLTYGWHLADRPSITSSSSSSSDVGTSLGALSTRSTSLTVPYPRPYRMFRFAAPKKKRPGIAVAKPPVAKKPPPKSPLPLWLYPMAVRPLGTKPHS